MNRIRTGLIIEEMELAAANAPRSRSVREKACNVTTVTIDNESDAKSLGREQGTYITVEMDKVYSITDSDFESITDVLSGHIRSLFDIPDRGRILIAGIGNREITADSLGPKCVDRIMVTRGLESNAPELLGKKGFMSVSAISADVFGVTGIESAEVIGGIAHMLSPELIIVIDALATTSLSRLCKTVQLSDTSLTPGGGVDNTRKRISPDNMKIPVLSIGMPTVIDVKTLLYNMDIDGSRISEGLGDYADSLIAVPTRIDSATDTAAKLIAFSLNKSLHHGMSTDDILRFLY